VAASTQTPTVRRPSQADGSGPIGQRSAPRWAGPAAILGVLLAFLLAPTFRAGQTSLLGWADQSVFVAALLELQAGGASAISERGTVGPAYLAAGRLIARVLGLEAGDALIVLARVSFLVLLTGVLLGARTSGLRFAWPVLAALGLAVLLTPWRYYSDVPWTHPMAAALLVVAAVAVRPGGLLPLRAAALGATVWLLAQTRSFELQALLAALAAAMLLLAAPTVWRRDAAAARRAARALTPAALWFAGGLAGAWLFVGLLSGSWSRFGQYETAAAAGTLTLDLRSVPTKLVQLFVDPCYRTYCGAVGDYAPQGLLPDDLEAYWRQPLLLQLPFLLAALVVVLSAAVVLGVQRRSLPFDVVVATLAAGALVLGYSANPIAGGAHLKYGFVRDFTAPAALLLYAAGRAIVHVAVERVQRQLTLPPAPVVALLAAVAVLALVPGQRLPRVGPVLVDVALAPGSTCLADRSAGCTLDAVGLDAAGDPVDLRDRVVLAVVCDGVLQPAYVTDGTLPREVAADAAVCRARGGRSAISYRPVELGVYQTPEGETDALYRTF
jgi:hypothetical protein